MAKAACSLAEVMAEDAKVEATSCGPGPGPVCQKDALELYAPPLLRVSALASKRDAFPICPPPVKEALPVSSMLSKETMPEMSLLCLSKACFPRRWAIEIVTHRFFEPIVIFVILCNCGTLAAQSNEPSFVESVLGKVLAMTDIIFLALFTVEMILKMLACGIILVPYSYFRTGWNYLDFLIIVTGYMALGPAGNYSAVRAIRVLRPLRTLGLVGGLRILVTTLLQSLPLLLDVVYMTMFFLIIFGVVCTQLYMGTFSTNCAPPNFEYTVLDNVTMTLQNVTYYDPASTQGTIAYGICTGPNLSDVTWNVNNTSGSSAVAVSGVPKTSQGHMCPWEADMLPDFPQGTYCVKAPRPEYRHFDNIIVAWLSIFQHITFCDYTFIMYDGQDAVSWWTWPLHIFMAVVGGFFLINLIVAVLYLHYVKAYVTKAPAKVFPANTEIAGPVNKSCIPGLQCVCKLWNCFRHLCKRLVNNRWFRNLSSFAILINSISIGLYWFNQPEEWGIICQRVTTACVCIYIVELLLSIVGRGFRAYIDEPIIIFDALVIIASTVDMAILLIPGRNTIFSGSIPVIRLITLLLYSEDWGGPSRIIKVLLSALACVGYLNVLIVMFLFTAGLIGMQILGFNLESCEMVQGSEQLCPPGLTFEECPNHLACYIGCDASQSLEWYEVQGSPYGGLAYCEIFPRGSAVGDKGVEYWAQVGKPFVVLLNYDNIFQALVSIFGLLTLDSWVTYMHYAMDQNSVIVALFYIGVIVIGNFILLALFLAILLSSLVDESEDDNTGEEPEPQDDKVDAVESGGGETLSKSMEGGAGVARLIGSSPPEGNEDGFNVNYDKRIMHDGPPALTSLTPKAAACLVDASAGVPADAGALVVFSSTFMLRESSSDRPACLKGGDAAPNGFRHFLNVKDVLDQMSQSTLLLPGRNGDKAIDGVSSGRSGRLRVDVSGHRPQGQFNSPKESHSRISSESISTESSASRSHTSNAQISSSFSVASGAKTRLGEVHYRGLEGVDEELRTSFFDESASMSRARSAIPGAATLHSGEQEEVVEQLHTSFPASSPKARKENDTHSLGFHQQIIQQATLGAETKAGHKLSRFLGLKASAMTFDKVNEMVARSSPSQASVISRSATIERVQSARSRGRNAATDNNITTLEGMHSRGSAGTRTDGLRGFSMNDLEGNPLGISQRPSMELVSPDRAEGVSAGRSRCAPLVLANPLSLPCPRIVPVSGPLLSIDTPIQEEWVEETSNVHPWIQAFHLRREASVAVSVGLSFNLLPPAHPLRYICVMIMSYQAVSWIFLMNDVLSCVILAVAQGNADFEHGPTLVIQIFVVSLFCAEALLKMLALGFVSNGPDSYLRNWYNVADLGIAVLGITIITSEAVLSSNNILVVPVWLLILRGLQGARVVRVGQRIGGVRVILGTIVTTVGEMGGVVITAFILYYIFAVLATHMFAGKLFYCQGVDSGDLLQSYYVLPESNKITKKWCFDNDSTHAITSSYYHSAINVRVPEWYLDTSWVAPATRFDNPYQSMWTLFQMASTEGWIDIMFSTVAAVGIDHQPEDNHQPSVEIFSVVFMIVGSFVILGLLAGVTINKFKERKESGAKVFMTSKQEEWVAIQKLLATTQLKRPRAVPKNKLRLWFYKLVHSSYFEWAMMTVIVANVIVMCLEHEGMSQSWKDGLRMFNIVAAGFYVTEVAVKWVALGIPQYFKGKWNVFDFVVTIFSIVGVVLDFINIGNLALLSIMRAARVLRILTLVPKARGLAMLVNSFLWVLPAAGNMLLVLLMLMFMYAIAGMNFFYNIGPGNPNLVEFTRHANFQSFKDTMLMLCRFTTGENWNAMMVEAMTKDDCVKISVTTIVNETTYLRGTYLDHVTDADVIASIPAENLSDECSISPTLAVVFFCSYMILVTFIVVQLLIGIILEELQATSYLEDLAVREDHVTNFKAVWVLFDTSASGFINISHFASLLRMLDPPFGVGPSNLAAHMKIYDTNILNRNQKLHFMEVMHSLATLNAGEEVPIEAEIDVTSDLVRRLPEEDAPAAHRTAAEFYAAKTLAAAVRGFLMRRKGSGFSPIQRTRFIKVPNPIFSMELMENDAYTSNQASPKAAPTPFSSDELREPVVTGMITGTPTDSKAASLALGIKGDVISSDDRLSYGDLMLPMPAFPNFS